MAVAGRKSPGSGRRERVPTPAEEAAWRRGLDLATHEGLREYLRRVATAVSTGKVPANRARAVATLGNAMRQLLSEASLDRRVDVLRKASDEIRRARQPDPMKLRDVGPPPDGFEQGLETGDALGGEEKN